MHFSAPWLKKNVSSVSLLKKSFSINLELMQLKALCSLNLNLFIHVTGLNLNFERRARGKVTSDTLFCRNVKEKWRWRSQYGINEGAFCAVSEVTSLAFLSTFNDYSVLGAVCLVQDELCFIYYLKALIAIFSFNINKVLLQPVIQSNLCNYRGI